MIRKRFLIGLAGLPLLILAGCNSDNSTASTGGTTPTATTSNSSSLPLVEFAQANSADPWRQVFDKETMAEAEKFKNDFKIEEQAAEDDANKQVSQIGTMQLKSPKVLLISPTTEAVQQAVEKVYDAGIPVILLDRAIPGDKYTCLIAGDNVDIGRQAAEYIAKRLNGKGTVLMIQGLGGASATNDRKKGALDDFKKYPGI
ncbi:MAG TPA: substrate-binding domain-containing protein, partial [Fimbriimonas sp.]|nr:substrate-binding domain-containing protein [Fimbriimonas sp.]